MPLNTTVDNDWSLYPYNPNKSAPIAFAILVAVVGTIQLYQSFFLYKWKKFGFIFLWAGAVWTAGFICRAISVRMVREVGIFIAQYVMILLGPPLYATSEYFILGRLMAYLPYHAPMHPSRVLTTFLLLETAVEALTANGAANSAGTGRTESQRTTGLTCIKAALILQSCLEAFFFSLVAYMHSRTSKSRQSTRRIKTILCVLYVTSFMMLVRCIFRTVEGFEQAECAVDDPYCGYVSRYEWFLYVFEVANIFVFILLLTVFHPGRMLPRDKNVFLDPINGQTERLGPGWNKVERRPLLLTIIDPFDFAGLLFGKGRTVDKFWERDYPPVQGGQAQESTKGHISSEAV